MTRYICNMKKSILIPNVKRDDRIGGVFNHLFGIIADTEEQEGDVEWDFRKASFLHPFFLGPLSIYKDKTAFQISSHIPKNTFLERYLDILHFESPLNIADIKQSDLETKYSSKTYSPICKFSGQDNSEKAQRLIEGILRSRIDARLCTPLTYFLSELICNINEHSLCRNGYLFAQYLPRDRTLNICIADDGITLYGSYMSSGKYKEKITSEASAIRMATMGYSTKNLPFAENRGYGISTTTQMLVDGLGGSFFILSGRAFHRHDREANQYVNLPEEINWDGTIILLRIPLSVPEGFNYIDYIS